MYKLSSFDSLRGREKKKKKEQRKTIKAMHLMPGLARQCAVDEFANLSSITLQ